MLNLSHCPSCRSQRIRKVRRDLRETFQGEAYTVSGLEFWECAVCGEKVYDREAMRKIEAHCPAYVRAVTGK